MHVGLVLRFVNWQLGYVLREYLPHLGCIGYLPKKSARQWRAQVTGNLVTGYFFNVIHLTQAKDI